MRTRYSVTSADTAAVARGEAMGPRRVLVIADRYPPSVHGGAEVSLSLTLAAMDPAEHHITVAALSDTADAVHDEVYEGIVVRRVPTAPRWPATIDGVAAQRMHARTFLRRQLGKAEAVARYAFTPRSRRSVRSRIMALKLFQELNKSGQLGWFPHMDADTVDLAPQITTINAIVRQMRPDLIHADNYRSILIAAATAPDDTPVVAHVRDNRFFCTHRNQATHIGATACARCTFGCVRDAGLTQARAVAALMEDDRAVRLAALARADRIVVASAYLKAQMERLTFAKPIDIVANPADEAAFVRACQDGVEQARPPEILIVGMVNHSKGQRRVPEWMPVLKERLGDFRIVLAGRGQMLERIKKDVAALGLSDHLHTPGFLTREAVYRAYARATVVVAPTVWPEPFGRVPLEAGLSSRPVVAYALGGLKETVVHGETGLLAPPQDQDALLDHIVRVLHAPDLAQRMGRRAFARVTAHYTRENAASGLRASWAACCSATALNRAAGAEPERVGDAASASFS